MTRGSLNDFVPCEVIGAAIHADRNSLNRLFEPKLLELRRRPELLSILGSDLLEDISGFCAEVAALELDATKANMRGCFLMNYEAALLHEQHQSAASVALSAAVAEQLVEELFYREGIVGSEKAKERTRSATISKRRFKDMRAGERILFLQEQKVLQPFLAERLEQGRQTRNNLMHKGRPVLPRDAGSYLTALRDLWALFLSSEFSLISTLPYRL